MQNLPRKSGIKFANATVNPNLVILEITVTKLIVVDTVPNSSDKRNLPAILTAMNRYKNIKISWLKNFSLEIFGASYS